MRFTVSTSSRTDFVDITNQAQKAIGMGNGTCLVFASHATCGIVLESPSSIKSLADKIEKIVPHLNYKHDLIDDNADAHLKAILIGPGKLLNIKNSKLVLEGKKIYLAEFDGPRSRNIIVKTISTT